MAGAGSYKHDQCNCCLCASKNPILSFLHNIIIACIVASFNHFRTRRTLRDNDKRPGQKVLIFGAVTI
ncbi:hypothetical protein BDP27DRAFT_1323520 [Rhodocollybia butyracea]|uniref:Uncharacterized protein n=1 Tax=Rhodocollybia butyracea TaxID=206335 RepID=A0A9P5PR06_9AGAR|nr:hypothetical protein BDP27DRAFT_1323520 [Rhodocollybia butyracea]